MKNQEFNNSAQKSSTYKLPIKKNSMGSMSNQAVSVNSNAHLGAKESSLLKQKMSFQQQQQQGSDLPSINPNQISSFLNRPFSEDTPNSSNKSEGKKAIFNRKTTIQQKQNQQQQMQQQIIQNSLSNGSSGQQQLQTLPKLRAQIDGSGGGGPLQNLGEQSAPEKGVEEQERRKPQGFVEKIRQLKNVNAKQTDIDSQNALVNSEYNSLKVNKLQSPATTMAFNTFKQAGENPFYKTNEEDQEEEEIEQKINREDTLFSDESSNSPIKSKFQLSSSDASNGIQTATGKSINLLQQKKDKQSNTTSSEDQGSKDIIKKVDFSQKDDKNQEERKTQKNENSIQDSNEKVIHTKSIRERLSLPEKNKDSSLQPIKEINRVNSTKEQPSQQINSSSNSNSNGAINEFESSKSSESIMQKIVKWKSGDFIGAGSFGQVFTAMNCNTGEIFVVKKIMVHGQSKLDKDFLDEQEKELRIMQTLSHKHIIQYKGHERLQDCLCIFLEYMSEGNIDQMLKKFGALEEQTIKVYARQILSGIQYLHSQKVIHKDIKGANILVGSDGIVKLSDFGCAKQLELTLNSNKEMNKTLKGSVPWMSPEIVTQTKYDTKADIWSFGCTILEMASAQAPWSNYQFDNPIAAIMKIGLSEEIPKIPDNISPDLTEFIKKCLQRDPSKRPTAMELLNDSFLAEN